MIELKTIYELYIGELVLKRNKIQDKLLEYLPKLETLTKLLINKEEIIRIYLELDLNTILSNTSEEKLKSIKYPIIPIYDEGKIINFDILQLYIKQYTWVNKVITKHKKEIQNINTQIIPFTTFTKIINKVNTKIIDRIVEENYEFNPLSSFGSLHVIKNENHNLRVNWGESNKRKAELIAEGKIPYKKADAESNPNYNGIKWLSYHPSLDFFLQWSKIYTAIKLNPFLSDYTYKPARGINSIVSKLQIVKKDRERALKLYTRTIKKI